MVDIYTSQYKYSGADRLDTTMKTGDKAFAPTKKMVYDIKYRGMSEEEYTEKYYELMRKSYRLRRKKWDALLNQERVVLICYCAEGKFCHRVLLARILEKLNASYKGEI